MKLLAGKVAFLVYLVFRHLPGDSYVGEELEAEAYILKLIFTFV